MSPDSGFKDLFSQAPDGYARHRPTYPLELVDLLARAAPATAVAWDAGCGSGQLSAVLAERFDRVLATDASAAQIASAAPHERVEYRVATAEASGIDAGVVDLAVAAQAAHWFDLPAYYAEVRRVAKPGAAVALVTYNLMRIAPEIDAVVDAFYWGVLWNPDHPYWPPERRYVDEGYRSVPFPFEEIPAPTVDIRTVRSLSDVIGYVETWSAVQAMAKDVGRGKTEEFFDRLRAVWGDASVERETVAPITTRLGRVLPA